MSSQRPRFSKSWIDIIFDIMDRLDVLESVPPGAHISAGDYLGDGTNNRQFVGFGFTPKFLIITEQWQYVSYYTYPRMSWQCYRMQPIGLKTNFMEIIVDGFEVNNSEPSDNLNINLNNYDYVVIG